MAPIQVYTKSPINAAKASGVTPQTAAPAEAANTTSPYQPPANPTPTRTIPQQQHQGPPPPQPGATPRLPEATGLPTATTSSTLPPPPRAGAAPQPPAPTAAPTQPPLGSGIGRTYPPPPQMAIPPPQPGYNQRGTSTGFGPAPATGAGGYPGSGGGGGDVDLGSGPAGYRQNASVSAYVPPAYDDDNYHRSGRGYGGREEEEEEEGVWGSAVKLAKAAGERLSAAESEVWRRINGEGGK